MTPDDKRRLAEMPRFVGPGPETDSAAGTIRFLRRLLDEAAAEASYWRKEAHREWDANNVAEVIAERDTAMARCQRSAEEYAHLASRSLAREDAAMAALRELTTMLRVRPDMASLIGPKESAIFYHAEAVLAAHSAATKHTEVQE